MTTAKGKLPLQFLQMGEDSAGVANCHSRPFRDEDSDPGSSISGALCRCYCTPWSSFPVTYPDSGRRLCETFGASVAVTLRS